MTSRFACARAARVLRDGGVIAYPTEAVYGLGCDPLDARAVARLLLLKERDPGMGLILIAAEMRQIEPYIDLPSSSDIRRRLAESWPGPVTWVLPARAGVPVWLTGRHPGIAVRVTAHPVARRLCALADSAIVSTSANRSGLKPARTALGVRLAFGSQIDSLLAGSTGKLAGPTEIRDALTGRVLRRADTRSSDDA